MSESAKKRWSTLRASVVFTSGMLTTREIENKLHEHCHFEYDPKDDCITAERLAHARESVMYHRTGCTLSKDEIKNLVKEQRCVRNMLNTGSFDVADAEEGDNEEQEAEKEEVGIDALEVLPPPQDDHSEKRKLEKSKRSNLNLKLKGMKVKARWDRSNENVLGVQKEDKSHHVDSSLTIHSSFKSLPKSHRRCSIKNSNYRGSIIDESFVKYNMRMQDGSCVDEEEKDMDLECVDYVRKPDLANCIQQYDAMTNHPKYSLRQVVLSRRFFLYAHRFANAQFQRTLVFPKLPQPKELYHGFGDGICGECNTQTEKITEKQRTRPKGHRFIITADTQYGILMDGFAMNNPNWSQEIEISRKCVEQINAMEGEDRPLFVCVCGDLVDTESSFSGAIASWKKVMKGWERNLVYEQQVNDFKRVWSQLHPDIALVCLCGNHDVGNRPTKASIEHWTSSFGDDYLSFWANGTFNLCLNNCLFSNPTGAPDLFDELCNWMEEKLAYARENDASHIFVYGHFPWFLKHEEEADDALTSHSAAPEGWGPPGTKFEDGYFTIPLEYRKIAMAMFKKYDVTACFSGHFHQNVTAKSSWGMPMIVTGPLSMNLYSSISHELANGEVNGIGMRIVDVGERGEFKHEWTLLDNEEEIFEHAIQRCERQLESEEKIAESLME